MEFSSKVHWTIIVMEKMWCCGNLVLPPVSPSAPCWEEEQEKNEQRRKSRDFSFRHFLHHRLGRWHFKWLGIFICQFFSISDIFSDSLKELTKPLKCFLFLFASTLDQTRGNLDGFSIGDVFLCSNCYLGIERSDIEETLSLTHISHPFSLILLGLFNIYV